MKRKIEPSQVLIHIWQCANGAWQYELWAVDSGERFYFGSDDFQHKTREEARKAAIEHREERCKSQEEE